MRPECQQCQEWMEEAFGAELKPELASALDSHLAGCAECRAAWEEFRLLRRGLDALAAEDDGPSPFVEAKILRAAAARNVAPARPSSFWRWLLNPAAVGFATLAIIAGLGYLGRQELLQHRRADDLTAPKAPPALTAPAADSLEPAAPVPAKPQAQPPSQKPEADLKAKSREEKAAAPAPVEKFQAAPKPTATRPLPPTPPAEERARSLSAPAEAPTGGGAPYKDDLLKEGGRAGAANIPEAEMAAPRTLDQETRKKTADEAKAADPAPAKALQRSAPAQPAAPAAQPAPVGSTMPATDKGDTGGGIGQAQTESSETGRLDQLVKSAKAKIGRQEYAGALDDLLAAQKIRDTKEIQDLILLCRSHLRGDG